MSSHVNTTLEALYRQHSSQMLAYLYRLTQDLDVSQELWHETIIDAMQHWNGNPPDCPAAWFKRIAKNKFIDRYRHLKMTTEKASLLKTLAEENKANKESENLRETDFGDEQLKLIFTCCHPALDFDKQVALTLNIIAGLSTEQVADALLLSTKTLEQRLTRAKRKIKQAAIPFVIPEKRHLAERLNAVLKTLYLMFNTGTQNPKDPYQLSTNATILVQRLTILLPFHAEIEGMLALMLFHSARKNARFDEQGQLIRLSEQDRSVWDADAIDRADALLQTAMNRNALGVYQLQAAIQGVHSMAKDYESTDWRQIEALYRVHLTLDNSPVVRLNAIYAISMSRSVNAALSELAKLKSAEDVSKSKIHQYAPLNALTADLYMRQQQWQSAIVELNQAIEHSTLPHEIQHFQKQIKICNKQSS